MDGRDSLEVGHEIGNGRHWYWYWFPCWEEWTLCTRAGDGEK